MEAVKEEHVLKLTFAKAYGEIDQYAFRHTDIFTKLRYLHFRESRLEQQKCETDSDINR